jgi:hypothetical protein
MRKISLVAAIALLLAGVGVWATSTIQRTGFERIVIRIQVKHRPSQKATRDEIAALRGIIAQNREMGLLVSSSGFATDAIREARHGTGHIELIDLERFLDQWMAHYERMTEEDKAKLRLRRVYFLAPEFSENRGSLFGDHAPRLIGKQLHRVVGQDTAGDRDRRERGLGRKLGARHHDLVDPGGDLLDRRREHHPAHVAPQDCAHTHRPTCRSLRPGAT